MAYSIGIIGTGYVGLVTGTCLAETGNSVLCIDVDPEKVERLRAGEVPIYEPGLGHLLERNIREQRIRFSTDVVEAVRDCMILMLCLPTPPDEDGSADLSYVLAASSRIATLLNELDVNDRRIIINKSTVPVGTTAAIDRTMRDIAPDRQFDVVSNPEFLSEGFAVEDFMKPDRVIVGTTSPYAAEILRDLYEPFVREGNPVLIFDEKSAEVAKYAANAFLATKISFMNDLSEYCEAVGANIELVRIGMGPDPRIGKMFLFAGVGYGGSCFPKDVKAIAHAARLAGTPLEIVEATQDVNHRQVHRFVDRIIARFDGHVAGRVFAVWGLAFKPDTDDVREAPSFVVIDRLLQLGATVQAYDPEAMLTSRRVLGDRITYATSANEAARNADALVVVTEWGEFRKPNWRILKERLLRPLVFDGRNIYELDDMLAEGIEYHSVGRPSVGAISLD
ncbi:MAG: UDP-glucose/GDP-mannose dehydrogenase family protein [Candidatus Kapabacteria bacterium]|nr:UDP-glucose/GDP-mannose dehydrogenase family protein [Candidatus Kapabacteria bacterium]